MADPCGAQAREWQKAVVRRAARHDRHRAKRHALFLAQKLVPDHLPGCPGNQHPRRDRVDELLAVEVWRLASPLEAAALELASEAREPVGRSGCHDEGSQQEGHKSEGPAPAVWS